MTKLTNFANLDTISLKTRRVLTAVMVTAVLVAAAAAIGKMVSGV